MTAKDGGVAFPVTYWAKDSTGELGVAQFTEGMTMRQFYKAAAILGLMNGVKIDGNDAIAYGPVWYAETAGAVADALIAEDEAHGREAK